MRAVSVACGIRWAPSYPGNNWKYSRSVAVYLQDGGIDSHVRSRQAGFEGNADVGGLLSVVSCDHVPIVIRLDAVTKSGHEAVLNAFRAFHLFGENRIVAIVYESIIGGWIGHSYPRLNDVHEADAKDSLVRDSCIVEALQVWLAYFDEVARFAQRHFVCFDNRFDDFFPGEVVANQR